MKSFLRIMMIVPVWLAGAVSALQWTINKEPDDEGRWEAGMKHFFGWLAPDMEPEWNTLSEASWSRKFHYVKNLGHEWIRNYPKRAYKLGSVLLMVFLMWAIVATIF